MMLTLPTTRDSPEVVTLSTIRLNVWRSIASVLLSLLLPLLLPALPLDCRGLRSVTRSPTVWNWRF